MTARKILSKALLEEGPSSLWKGVSQPLMGSAPTTTIIFITNDYVKSFLSTSYPEMTTTYKAMLAGMAGGIVSLPIICPVELLKCRA